MQEVVPVLHGSPVAQVAPALQATQLPPLHTRFVPQVVPSGADPIAWQVAVPVWQVYVPTWQGALGVQLPPAMQLPHVPPLHTLLFPHEVPFAMLPVSAQTEVPVAHDVAPVRHAVAGVQVTPAVQLLQVPALHTLLFPHEVPFATFPVSAQMEVPVAHDVAPVRQAVAGVQVTPAVQAPQAPLLHTLFVPQEVPFATFPDSVQTGTPVAHEVAPVRQAVAGVQTAPTVQAPQAPLLHTMLVPQEVPLETFPDSVQTGAPVSQAIAPVRHGLPLTLQVAPDGAAHAAPRRAADLVGAAAGSSGEERPLVVADRRAGRAVQRSLMAGVRGHAAGAIRADAAPSGEAHHPRTARGAVRLITGFGAD